MDFKCKSFPLKNDPSHFYFQTTPLAHKCELNILKQSSAEKNVKFGIPFHTTVLSREYQGNGYSKKV